MINQRQRIVSNRSAEYCKVRVSSLGALFFMLLPMLNVSAQLMPQDPHTIFLLGNVADIADMGPYIDQLDALLSDRSHKSTFVLNGDVLRRDANFGEGTLALDQLLTKLISFENLEVVLVPGDRDWKDGEEQGLENVLLLEEFINSKSYPRVYFPVRKGCPGPELWQVRPDLNLLLLNTQWHNHLHDKPRAESAECGTATEAGVIEEIEDLVEDQTVGNLMIVGHHPVFSNGKYGGRYPWYEWLLPVPGIAQFITSYKQNVGGKYETGNAKFKHFRDHLRSVLADQFSLVYASGHEKNIEIVRDFENVMINSGAPIKGGHVRTIKETIRASKNPGLVAVTYHATGLVESTVYQLEDAGFQMLPKDVLFQAPCTSPLPDIPVNLRQVPCVDDVQPDLTATINHPEALKIVANPNYVAKGLKRKFLGQHYRKSWTTQIEAPVLDLYGYAGGLKALEKGGGRQTTSLKFRATSDLEYVFRSVDKDPSKALSRDLRTTIISTLLRDQTTTQQPYGALTASHLMDHLDILHATPQLFVMPNDPKLGLYGSEFGGMLGLMEERPVDPINGHSFADADDVKRSVNLFRRMYQDRDFSINVEEFVRVRVFDILVGDWGKHEDNWKWAGYESDDGFNYRPIPRDRDHVFSSWDGILPWLADREWAKASGENFDYEIKGLRSLMWQARHLDRFVASEADQAAWLAAAAYIQDHISDAEIAAAVAQMPAEIYEDDGKIIEAKLKSRIKDLDKYADEYYQMLAKEVDVVGSNKHELYEVERLENGNVRVRMFKIRRDKKDELFYERLFIHSETKEIRLFGLAGDDQFELTGAAEQSILIRIIPGPGEDKVNDQSSVKGGAKKTLVYDRSGSTPMESKGEIKKVTSADHNAYQYNRTSFTYPTYFPIAYAGWSSDKSFFLNGGIKFTKQAYDKPGFSAIHALGFGVSVNGNFEFTYDGTWRHVLGSMDLIAGAALQKRTRYRYFFGLGNETQYDEDLLLDDYYTLEYTSANTYVGLEQTFWKNSGFNFRFQYETNGGQKSSNTILDDLSVFGEESLDMGKLIFELDLDFRDRPYLPLQGARFFTRHLIASPLNKIDKTYFTGEALAEYYLTGGPFTLGLRTGAAYSRNDVPYYDLPRIGQGDHLRGYRQNRFVGDGYVFFNSDVRLQIIDKQNALVPFKIGLRLFVDQAKSSLHDVNSSTWHTGYGGGVYFVPLKEQFNLHVGMAFSKEESGLFFFGLGSSF